MQASSLEWPSSWSGPQASQAVSHNKRLSIQLLGIPFSLLACFSATSHLHDVDGFQVDVLLEVHRLVLLLWLAVLAYHHSDLSSANHVQPVSLSAALMQSCVWSGRACRDLALQVCRVVFVCERTRPPRIAPSTQTHTRFSSQLHQMIRVKPSGCMSSAVQHVVEPERQRR
jgi:hypothetical protein